MPALTARQRMNVVRCYLQGFSYDQIVDRTKISKGSVVGILTDLKNGTFHGLENVYEEIDALREIAVDLRRRDLSLSHAILGLTAFQGIEALGVQPADINKVVAMCQRLTPLGTEPQDFLAAVSAVVDVEQRTGTTPKELEARVGELEERYHTLEQRCKDLEPMSTKVIALTGQRDSLITQLAVLGATAKEENESLDAEIGERTKQLQRLQSQVAATEQLVGQLGRRVLDQEESLQQISRRSDRASNDLKRLLSLGFSENELPELATRLASAAYHHNMEPTQFQEWLFTCLDQASSLLGLDTMIKCRRDDVIKEERKLATARKNQETLAAELKTLKKQSTGERASQKSRRNVWEQESEALRCSSDQRLSTQQVQLQETARALGNLEGNIDSYVWVRPLVNLIQGIDGVTTKEVRIAATFLCLSLRRYLELHVESHDKPARIEFLLEKLLEVLERWET